MYLFSLHLQITEPDVINEYRETDPDIITEDLQYGSLLDVCTLQDPSVTPALRLELEVHLGDLEEDEGEYGSDEVFKELKLHPFWVKHAKYVA